MPVVIVDPKGQPGIRGHGARPLLVWTLDVTVSS